MASAKTTNIVVKVTGDTKSASSSMRSAGKDVEGLGSKLKGVLKIAGGVALGNAITDVAKKVTSFAKSSIKAFSDTAKAAVDFQKVSGGSVHSASQLLAIAKKFGISSTQLTTGVRTLDKASQSGSASFAKYNIKAGSTNSMLKQLADQFAKMPNGPKKTAEAQTLLGRSGTALIPILNKGSKGLAQLRKASDDAGTSITNKAAGSFIKARNAGRELSEATDGLKIKLGAALEPAIAKVETLIAKKFIPILEKGANKYLPEIEHAANSLATQLIALAPTVLKIAQKSLPAFAVGARVVVGLVKSLAQFLAKNASWLSKVAVALLPLIAAWKVYSVVSKTVKAVTVAMTEAQAAFNAVLDANPIGLVVLAVAALAIGIVEAYKHSQKFRDIVKKALSDVKAAFDALKKAGDALLSGLDATFDAIKKSAEALWHGIDSAFNHVKDAFTTVISFIRQHWKLITAILGGPFVAIVILIASHFKTIRSHFTDVINFIKEHWKAVLGFLEAPFKAIITFIANHFSTVRDKFTGIIGFIRDHWKLILGILTGPFGLLVTYISTHFTKIINIISGIPRRITNASKGMFDGIKDAFRDAINFVIDGWNNLSFTLPSVNTHIPGVGHIGGWTLSTPNIPRLAKGGITTGPTIALIGESGPEAIIPLNSQTGLGNVYNITVNAPVGSNPADIGRTIVKYIDAYNGVGGRRRTATA